MVTAYLMVGGLRASCVLLSDIFRCWDSRGLASRKTTLADRKKTTAGYIPSARTRISLSENKRRKRLRTFPLTAFGNEALRALKDSRASWKALQENNFLPAARAGAKKILAVISTVTESLLVVQSPSTKNLVIAM